MMHGIGFGGYHGYGMWNYFVIGGILLIAVALILWNKNKSQNSNINVLELLKEKYVLGEITEEEYIKRRNVLERK